MKHKIVIAALLFAGSISQIQSFQWLKDKFKAITQSDSAEAAEQYRRDGYKIFQGQRRGDIHYAQQRINDLEEILDEQLDACAKASDQKKEEDCLANLSATVDSIEEQMRYSNQAKSRLEDSIAREEQKRLGK